MEKLELMCQEAKNTTSKLSIMNNKEKRRF